MVIAAVVCSVMYATAGVAEQTRCKARHYLYEGLRFDAEGARDKAYEMYRHAYKTDPTMVEAAAQYGFVRLMIELDTLQSNAELLRSLKMMQGNVDKYPDDYFESEHYAYIAQLLDTLDETIRVLRRVDSLAPDRTEGLLRLAQAYAQKYDFKNAIAALDSFESREGPNNELAQYRMAWRLAEGDTLGAIADADRMIALNPTTPHPYILKGNLYDFLVRPDSALAMYLKANEIDTVSALPKMALAKAYRDMGDSIRFDEMMYRSLLAEDLDMDEKLGILAEYLQTLINNKEDTIRGDNLFKVLATQYPYEPEVLDLSARYNAAKGNTAMAIENISYALDQNRDNGDYWAQLMSYQLQGDKPKDAMETYREAVKNVTPDNGLKVLYATAAQMNHDYDTVVSVYSGIIHDIAPDVAINDSIDIYRLHNVSYQDITVLSNSFTSIGDAYFEAKDTVGAFRAYDNALALLPNNPLTLNNYAYFMSISGGNLEKADSLAKIAIEMVPDSPTFQDTYAWILFLRHDYPNALKYQEAAVEASERDKSVSPELYSHYADILFMNGKPEEALKYWKKALEIDKGDLSEKEVKLLKKKIDHKTFFFE